MSTWRIELEGGLVREGTMNNRGTPHGFFREWFPNGQLRLEHQYDNGELHGICRQFASDGKLIGEFTMDHGDGICLEYYDSAILKMRLRQFHLGDKYCDMMEIFDIYGKHPIRAYTWKGHPVRTKKRFLKLLGECQLVLPPGDSINDPVAWARFAKEARAFVPKAKKK